MRQYILAAVGVPSFRASLQQLVLICSMLAVGFAQAGSAISADEARSLHVSHKDWELACDNSGTCRAIGHSPIDADHAAALLLERPAGTPSVLIGKLKIGVITAEELVELPKIALLQLNNQSLGELNFNEAEAELSAAQISALLLALPANARIVISENNRQWLISDAGATATLLKMDDFQQRLNTQSALVKKGNQPESQVLPASRVPRLQAVRLAGELQQLSEIDTAKLLPKLKEAVTEDDCPLLFDRADEQAEPVERLQLAEDKQLISTLCWRAAYNEGYGYWLLADGQASLISSQAATYSNGAISASQRGRGIGDCSSQSEWQWDGESFVKIYERQNELCRLIDIGGAWPLALWRVEVLPAR